MLVKKNRSGLLDDVAVLLRVQVVDRRRSNPSALLDFIGEKAVGRRIVVATCCTIGPFFSLSANTRARSGSLANVLNLATRSLRLSHASM